MPCLVTFILAAPFLLVDANRINLEQGHLHVATHNKSALNENRVNDIVPDESVARCGRHVHDSMLRESWQEEGDSGEICKCVRGEHITGAREHCHPAEETRKFDPLAFEGCLCAPIESHEMCGKRVDGAVLRESWHQLKESGDDQICKCPSASWITGAAGHCRPGFDTRKFDPSAFNGCRCAWDYSHVPDWREHLETYWGDLLHTNNPQGSEPQCQPFIEGSGSRGVVFLMHGATACSGWWYLVKEPLIAEGWMVIATTHIGHGRKPSIPGVGANADDWHITDYLEDMPVDGMAFIDYSLELNRAMKKYHDVNPDKEMVLMGHSIGGALSTNMVLDMPHMWNRVLVMNPFFAPAQLPSFLPGVAHAGITSVLMPLAEYYQGAQGGDRLRWSSDCDDNRLTGHGHGGMCQFRLSNLGAWFELGHYVQQRITTLGRERSVYRDNHWALGWHSARGLYNRATGNVHNSSATVRVQIISTVNEPAIKNENVAFLANVASEFSADSHFCVFPEEFTHNWVAPVDEPDWNRRDHWWLDRGRVEGGRTAIDHVTAFVRDGTPVPTAGVVTEEMGDSHIIGADLCNVHRSR